MAVGSSSAAAPESATAPAVKKPCKLVTKVVRGKRVKVRVCPKAAKKKCKFVTKRIKGKKKRVRVCAKPVKRTTPAPTRQDVVARTVAERLAGATTVREREQALLEAARALHLGVYREDGTPLLKGAERSDHDFLVYDFELSILAEALSRGETVDLAGFAELLSDLGIRRGGSALQPGDLAQILVTGTQSALRSPTDPRAIVPLLVRELGLRARPAYDLAREAPLGLRLDAFQRLLLVADVASRPSRSLAGSAVPGSHVPPRGCLNFSGDPNLNVSFGGYEWTGTTSPSSAAFQHAAILSEALRLRTSSAEGQETHYGHEQPGKALEFRVVLDMTVQVPREIRCGPLAGLRIWDKGEVTDPDAVSWESEVKAPTGPPHPLDPRHGRVEQRVLVGGGDHGVRRFTFSPKTERVPNFGEERAAVGFVRAKLNYTFRVAGDTFTLGDSQTWPVKVAYHKPRGYKFPPVSFSFQVVNDNCTENLGGPCTVSDTLSGRICGEDPYGDGERPWEIRSTRVANYPHDPIVAAGGIEYTLMLDQPIVVGEDRRAVEWVPPPPGQADYKVKVTYKLAAGGWQPTSPSSVTVPLAEDTSCPDNDT
jgi:hypothetical protein